MKWTLIYTFFRSLSLAHLERSLFSVSRQTIKPTEFLFFDNNTDFAQSEILPAVTKHIELLNFDELQIVFAKHKDASRSTASWAHNQAIRSALNDVFILMRADCIYDFTFCERLLAVHRGMPRTFAAAWMLQMAYLNEAGKPHEQVNHAIDLETLNWREDPRRLNQHTVNSQLHNVPHLDGASFCTTKSAVARAGWYNENLRGWGYWQMELQERMRNLGMVFNIIPEVLSWHMLHAIEGGERDLNRAQAELAKSAGRSTSV